MPRILFEKIGNAIWISHLDLMRVFQRAFKRSGVAIGFSQGYSPRAYVSIALPLSVGAESICEILEFDLDPANDVPFSEIPMRLNQTLPSGIRVLSIWNDGRKMRELTHLDAVITLEYDKDIPAAAEETIQNFFQDEHAIIVDKRTKSGGITKLDMREMITRFQIRRKNTNEMEILCRICAQNPSLNPMLIPEAIRLYLPALTPDFAKVRRIEVLDAFGVPFR